MNASYVLVLEDNEDQRRVFTRTLLEAGYEVWPAATLAEARGVLNRFPVDVFLCDINLDGEQSLGLLEEGMGTPGWRDVKVVVVSVEAQYRSLCAELGVELFLEKPVDLQDLLGLVGRLTGRSICDP